MRDAANSSLHCCAHGGCSQGDARRAVCMGLGAGLRGWGSADEEGAWRLRDLERRRGVGGRNDNSVNEAEGKKMWHLRSLSPEKVEISH